ncbi:MAG: alpha/beta fold hydrolase [Salinibacterium sp.]|nr:alpha/beta fold hydrolase [Salinibacterium sp.]
METQPRGAHSGPPVLLIHGFASDSSDWTGWPDALAAAGRGSILVDLPGHGRTPAPDSLDDASTTHIVDALATVVHEHPAIDVVAYSLGARLAWELPAIAPVRRLVLGGLSPVEPFGALDFAQVEAFVAHGVAPTDGLTSMLMGMISAPGKDASALALVMQGLATEPFAPVDGPAVPTLFVSGDGDPMAAGVDALVAITPGAQRVTVPGDHLGALRSTEFRAAALGFLGI